MDILAWKCKFWCELGRVFIFWLPHSFEKTIFSLVRISSQASSYNNWLHSCVFRFLKKRNENGLSGHIFFFWLTNFDAAEFAITSSLPVTQTTKKMAFALFLFQCSLTRDVDITMLHFELVGGPCWTTISLRQIQTEMEKVRLTSLGRRLTLVC